MHPDVVEFEPGGASYKVDDIREKVIPEAHRSPVEGERKVLLLFEAEKLSVPPAVAANALLKTFEEPPARTVIVLVSSSADDLLPTIRSRCQRVDFDPVPDDTLRAALEADGMSGSRGRARRRRSRAASSRVPARSPGRSPTSARSSRTAPSRLDGTGATALAVAEQLDAAVSGAADELATRHAEGARRVRRRDGALRLLRPRRAAHAAATRRAAQARAASYPHRSPARRCHRDRDPSTGT